MVRSEGKDGILHGSVRHEGGICAVAFRPRLLRNRRQSKHYAFHFDGSHIVANRRTANGLDSLIVTALACRVRSSDHKEAHEIERQARREAEA